MTADESTDIKVTRQPSFIVVCIYLVAALAANFADSLSGLPMYITAAVSLVKQAVIVAVLVMIVTTVLKRQITPADWGVVFNKRIIFSLALIGVSILLVAPRMPALVSFSDPLAVWKILAAGIEELIFRVYLLYLFMRVFGPGRSRILAAVLASAGIFMLIHVPSKTAVQLTNIFVAGVLMAYIVVYTKSVLYPAFIHVLINTSEGTGFLGAMSVLILYLCAVLILRERRNRVPSGISMGGLE